MVELDFQVLVETSPDLIGILDREQRYLYINAALERVLGMPRARLVGTRADAAMPQEGARVWREAMEEVLRMGRERVIECSLGTPEGPRRFESLITSLPGQRACAVWRELADVSSAHWPAAATCLAETGALLEHFDPETSLQATADLAVPRLADWCFIYLKTGSHPVMVAIANADPAKVAEVRAANATPQPLLPDTALARVLAGGPRELVTLDDGVVAPCAPDPEPPAHLRGWGGRSAVIAPLAGREGVLGAVVFAMAESGRRYEAADLDMLAEIAHRTGIALENARLFAAKQHARRRAEEARDRMRRLQTLSAALSSAIEREQVVAIMVDAGRAALGSDSGYAWLLREDDMLELTALEHAGSLDHVDQLRRVPMTAPIPLCDVVRTARPMIFESLAALTSRYPLASPSGDNPSRAWAVMPFVVAERGVGAMMFSFLHERAFSDDDRELMVAMTGLASLALERCMLAEAERRARAEAEAARKRERELQEQLRFALTAARAATWKIDLATMASTRDTSYLSLVGASEARITPDFDSVHPEDRELMKAQFERALRDGAAFEPEVRIRRDDGTYMWLRSHGRVAYGPDGMPSMLAGVIVDIDEAKRASLRAEEERRISETLHRLGSSFASELDRDRLVRLITDEVAKLVGAEHGAFVAGDGDAADRRDPPAQPATGSFFAVPVVARTGEVFGSLRFGHPEPGRFTGEHERLAASIAGQAAVALENSRLYQTVRAQKDQLELAVERARLADRRKDEFLAMLGHELRNPLAPIATALELMEFKGSGTLRRERDVIRRQVDHLSRLIDDLLDVSRITRGKIKLALRVTEVSDVLVKAVEMASPLLEKRMQQLAIDVPREGLAVDADPTRLAQVFQNLLTNAAKYSEPRTRITLRARADEERIVVEVRDQGIGIPADVLPRLFDLFAQGDRALDRSEGGLGIGLTIAKSLCELHGGTISAASGGNGHGSTFTVTLPRTTRTEAPRTRRTGEHLARATTGVRVLVVDDNVDAAVTLRDLLAGIGHEVAAAYDGVAALELARTFQPDVAVLDIGLPVMDGYELARKLRDQQCRDSLRLIAVTGYGQDSDLARAREAGFDHHLIKPVAFDALIPLMEAKEVKEAKEPGR